MEPQIVRGLNDKLYDKRKAAALEVERLIRECIVSNDSARVRQIIHSLCQDFAYSVMPNARNGGLIGLAAASIALGPEVARYLEEIVPPVLACFGDQDSRVRYYACESMYNIAKVAKGEVLLFFNEVFDALSKLAADSELSVKNGAELLDRLVKDIVAEQSTTYVSVLQYADPDKPITEYVDDPDGPVYASDGPRTIAFSLSRFIPLLSERIHAINPFTRNFLVSWISVLDSVPDLDLVSYLPDFLDGLLKYLSDPNSDIRVATSVVLADFLREIKEVAEVRQAQDDDVEEAGDSAFSTGSPLSRDTTLQNDSTIDNNASSIAASETAEKGAWGPGQGVDVDYAAIVRILIPRLTTPDEEIQATALKWISELLTIANDVMVPFAPQLISAVLPSLAHDTGPIRAAATQTNANLFQLIQELAVGAPSPPSKPSSPTPDSSGAAPVTAATEPRADEADQFDWSAAVTALMDLIVHEREEARVAALDWLIMLHKKAPRLIFSFEDGTFAALLRTLSDPSEEVIRRDLQLLAQISSVSDEQSFRNLMSNIINLFSSDRKLLETRGSLIIRQLCVSLGSESVYRALAEILEVQDDLEFAGIMVQNLNVILVTSPELADARKRLKNLNDNREAQMLFSVLYRSWCHNPVAVFTLCLMSQAYEHASTLLMSFADLEMTVNFLIQIDKLVQLLESPVFTYLRLQLLEPEKHHYLFKCLYGLLMLLPQSSAFATLRNRLNAVSSIGYMHLAKPVPSTDRAATNTGGVIGAALGPGTRKRTADEIQWAALLSHFKSVQSRHERARKRAHAQKGSISSTSAPSASGTAATTSSRTSKRTPAVAGSKSGLGGVLNNAGNSISSRIASFSSPPARPMSPPSRGRKSIGKK